MTRPARIPADLDRPDRVLGPFSTRQIVLLAIPAALLYGGWSGLRGVVAAPVLLGAAVPIAALSVAVALGHRDGLPLDRYLLAALRHHLPRRPTRLPALRRRPTGQAHAAQPGSPLTRLEPGERRGPTGWLDTATVTAAGRDPGGAGVLDLGGEGLVAIAALSTLNLGLRTPAEQDALVAGFARYLHTLTGPVQFLVRTLPLDLRAHLQLLGHHAVTLPHPALAAAARAHHTHLTQLTTPTSPDDITDAGTGGNGGGSGVVGGGHELVARQVLLVLREPAHRGGPAALLRRLEDATAFLGPLEVTVTALTAAQITALLTDCCTPDHHLDTRAKKPLGAASTAGRTPDGRGSDDTVPLPRITPPAPAVRSRSGPSGARRTRPAGSSTALPSPRRPVTPRIGAEARRAARSVPPGPGGFDDEQLEELSLAQDGWAPPADHLPPAGPADPYRGVADEPGYARAGFGVADDYDDRYGDGYDAEFRDDPDRNAGDAAGWWS